MNHEKQIKAFLHFSDQQKWLIGTAQQGKRQGHRPGWGCGGLGRGREDRRKGRLPADEVTEAEVVHPSCKQTFSVSEGQRG